MTLLNEIDLCVQLERTTLWLTTGYCSLIVALVASLERHRNFDDR